MSPPATQARRTRVSRSTARRTSPWRRPIRRPTVVRSIPTHAGTHLEAPRHLHEDGRTIDESPAERWLSRGLVCEVDADPLERIDVDRIDPPADPEPGDALLLRTGWEDRVGEESYFEQPYLSAEAAAWIVEAGFGWAGIDSPSPEMPVQLREEPFDYPVHATLLGNDVPIAEHVTNLASVAGSVVDAIALPLRYVGSDGAHARIVAWPGRAARAPRFFRIGGDDRRMEITVYGPLRSATGGKRVTVEPEGTTVAAAIDAFVAAYPRAASQILDDDGDLRPSVRVTVDGERAPLDADCPPDAEVALFPAMRGG
ncbi:MAG: ubiquitin-like small modifier protein 1 [Haloferacaceae archaeon]